MGLNVRVPDGDGERSLQFGDDVEQVVFGRDPDRCQVVFAPEDTAVGREHFSLKRVLGDYVFVLDPDHLVMVADEEAADGQELPHQCRLQLGPGGPICVVRKVERSDLLPTMDQGHRPGQAERVEEAAALARRNRRITVGVLLLLAAVVAGLVYLAGGGREPTIDAALRAARPSVYLVILERDDGSERAWGTAWVVGDGVLATNAHIAEAIEKLAEGRRMLVRSNAVPHSSYPVARVTTHPGYKTFWELWEHYQPALGTTEEAPQTVRHVSACDVALLHLTPPWDGLAVPLELASEAVLAELDAGEAVGYVGYPTEGLVYGGTPLRKPSPQSQVGAVTAVTDFFGARPDTRGIGDTAYLVQHNCPITGGSSGSPLLNARGHVVALVNAGNFAFFQGGRRVMSGVGVNFAQRVDLLRELLDDTAAGRQEARVEEWRRTMSVLYQEGYSLLLQRAEKDVLVWARAELEIASGMREMYELEPLAEASAAAVTREAAPAADTPIIIPEAGTYVLVGTTRPVDYGLELELGFEGDGGATGEVVVSHKRNWPRYRILNAGGKGTLHCRGITELENRIVRFQLYRVRSQPMTGDALRERIQADWLAAVRQEAWGEYAPQEVATQTAAIDPAAGVRTRFQASFVDVAPGRILVTAVFPPEVEHAEIAVVHAASGRTIVEDWEPTRARYFNWHYFTLEETMSLSVLTQGSHEGVPPVVHVFRAMTAE